MIALTLKDCSDSIPREMKQSLTNLLLALRCRKSLHAKGGQVQSDTSKLTGRVADGIRSQWKALVKGYLLAKGGYSFDVPIPSNKYSILLDATKDTPSSGNDLFIFSTSKGEERLVERMALIATLFEVSGGRFGRGWAVCPNPDYIRSGEGMDDSLFLVEEITPTCRQLEAAKENLSSLESAIQSNKGLTSSPGEHCKKMRCPEYESCQKKAPGHVSKLPRLGKKKKLLEDLGIELIQNLPHDFPLTPHQEVVAEAVRCGRPIIDREKVSEFVRGIRYPISFFDVETIASPTPPFNKTRPNQRIVFQYSIHVEAVPCGPLTHYEFLPEGAGDPRREFVMALLEALPSSGSVVVYHAGFERGVLRELAEAFPEFARELLAIVPRMVDLEVPFSARWYCDPGFLGSSSLKKVYPVLCPQASQYSALSIQNGEQASSVFLGYAHGILSKSEYEVFRPEMLAYCGLDTESMAAILVRLREIIVIGDKI